MKRLAFWMVLGVVAMGLVGRRHRSAHAWADHPRRGEVRVTTVTSWDDDLPEPPTPPPAPKRTSARIRVARQAPPAPPRPPAPPSAPADPKRQPDWFPKDRDAVATLGKPAAIGETRPATDARGRVVLVGAIKSSEPKARADLRRKVEQEVVGWLAGDVAPGWNTPARAIDGLLAETYVQPVVENLGEVSKDLDELVTLYRAGARVDFSRENRARLVGLHDREVVRGRMIRGGGLLAFALVALATLGGYIRADEATRGTRTNRLRMLAAAAVGAAGVVTYRMLA